MTDASQDTRGLRVALALFAAVAVLVALDLAGDWASGGDWWHLASELLAVAAAAAGAAYLWARLSAARRQAVSLGRDLVHARREAERWKAEARQLLEGLGEAVDRQFERWQLTAAEREVGLLLLKGLSHKEVAEVRRTSERTVRQQALAVYRKAGLAGRAELSAFFFEDLLLPASPTTPGGAPPSDRSPPADGLRAGR